MVLVGLCIVGVVLGNLQNGARINRRVDPLEATIHAIIEPIAIPISKSTRATTDFFGGIFEARRLSEENRSMRALLANMALYTEQIEARDREIASYRKLEGFGPIPGKERVKAEVVGLSINENRLTLDVGSRQGVKLGCPVECVDGLVGTIEEVEPNESQVLMLTSAGLQATSSGKTQLIGAMDVNRDPPAAGLLRGENASTLSLTFVDPKSPVQIGDLIVTTGYSKQIPPWITIGKVIQIEPNEAFGTLKAMIDPAFSPGNLDVVFVLK